MKSQWILLGLAATTAVATAQRPTSTQLRVQADALSPYIVSKNAPPGVPTAPQGGQQLLNGSDDCSTADAISGTGVFAFNNAVGTATTGLNGQLNTPACTFYNLTAIALDVWFLWTAPTTGFAIISTCGQTSVDTKMAVYDWAAIGSTCPANGAGSTVLGCNDDVSGAKLQSRVIIAATAGQQYLIQLGTYPGGTPAGGTGNISIEYDPIPEVNPCIVDDGNADARARLNAPATGEQVMMQAFGDPGEITTVTSIEVAYGAGYGIANTSLVDGTPVTVAIWDDPNDDYDPTDAVLIETVSSTILNHDTDMFNTVPLAASHVINGVYFIGFGLLQPSPTPANYWPFGWDLENCEALPGDCWGGWSAAGVAYDYSVLTNNVQVPGVLLPVFGVASTNVALMIRPTCFVAPPFPGFSVCANQDLSVTHTTPCPCGNVGLAGNGCAHSFSPDGANMVANGVIADDNVAAPGPNPVILTASNEPATAFTLFMQHDAVADGVFHDGVLCAGGTLIRLRGRGAGVSQGQPPGVAIFPNSTFPQDATLTLSSRGGQTPGNGNTRRYAAWYRNASTTFCPPATANVSNGWEITW